MRVQAVLTTPTLVAPYELVDARLSDQLLHIAQSWRGTAASVGGVQGYFRWYRYDIAVKRPDFFLLITSLSSEHLSLVIFHHDRSRIWCGHPCHLSVFMLLSDFRSFLINKTRNEFLGSRTKMRNIHIVCPLLMNSKDVNRMGNVERRGEAHD